MFIQSKCDPSSFSNVSWRHPTALEQSRLHRVRRITDLNQQLKIETVAVSTDVYVFTIFPYSINNLVTTYKVSPKHPYTLHVYEDSGCLPTTITRRRHVAYHGRIKLLTNKRVLSSTLTYSVMSNSYNDGR